MNERPICRGGCLCGALRYGAAGEPPYTGHRYSTDCRKASGSGFIPFMPFAGSAIHFEGRSTTLRPRPPGGDAVRNSCPACSSLVFGGRVREDETPTIDAGSLDDPSLFKPRIAIFAASRPPWAVIRQG